MRTPSLTFETFLAALTIVNAGSALGCSKADRVSAAPAAISTEPAASATAASPRQEENAPARAAAQGAPSASGSVPPVPPVQATPAASAGRPSPNKKAGASCGAGGCTPDMKKGNGN